VFNLECLLTGKVSPIDKTGPCLKAPPAAVEFTKRLGFSVATLANNHILYQGADGLMETIRHCREAGLETVGAGKNLEDAGRVLKLKIKGYSIVILNYCEREFSIAGPESPGANPFDLINCLNDLEAIRKNSDLIVLVIHGGIEHYHLPSPERRHTYRFLAEQIGVSAIISHHTHCPSAYEKWKGVPIFYGLALQRYLNIFIIDYGRVICYTPKLKPKGGRLCYHKFETKSIYFLFLSLL
jgi:poly-gamma-glutamate synthesis protein (capsule biosynthesis protein)